MTEESIQVLNITQQVLRGMLISLAAGNKSNLGDIGNALEAFAANDALDPMAKQMLADLASGATGLYSAGIRKQ